MLPRQLQLVLCGVQAAAQALTRLAIGICKDLSREAKMLKALPDLVEPAQYFVSNLASRQPSVCVLCVFSV